MHRNGIATAGKEVVVVGGGYGGLASAARLAKQGHAVTLVEAAPGLLPGLDLGTDGVDKLELRLDAALVGGVDLDGVEPVVHEFVPSGRAAGYCDVLQVGFVRHYVGGCFT